MRKRPILLVPALALGLLVVACAPAAAPPPAAKEAAPAQKEAAPAAKKGLTPADALGPKYGGILNTDRAYDWPNLDPHQTLTAGMHGVVGLVYGTLLRFETGPGVSGLKIIPSIAESWTQPDDKTYVFKLRQGVKWHNLPPVNGREFTADDVVYSIKRIATPGWISAPLVADVEKVEAVDKYTVKFTLKGPSAPFLPYMANAYIKMVAKEAVDVGGGELKTGPTIGTGPFYVGKDDIKPKVGITLRKNPDYWEKDAQGNQLPYLDGTENPIVPDAATKFAALRTAKFDFDACSKADCGILTKASPEVAIVLAKSWSASQYGLKLTKAPFNDLRVRKAVSLALDRKTLQETISPGVDAEKEGWYHLSFTMPDESWVLPQEEFEKAWKYDPEEAKRLLAEAGHPNGFDVTFTCANYGAATITSCEFILDGLKKVGIRAKMKIVDQPTYSAHVFAGEGDFEMYYGPQGVFLEPDQWLSAYYRTGGPRNVNGINDPKLNALIDAQRVELNLEKRKAILQEVQRYLLTQYYHLHSRASAAGTTAVWPWLGNYSSVSDYPTQRSDAYMWLNQDLKKQYGK